MKQVTLYLLSLLFSAAAFADPGPVPGKASAEKNALFNAGVVRLQFNKINVADDHQDSVLVIFDRFDHTGAGVVYSVYATDDEHGITLPAVPAGKYFVTIQCRGLHHDRMEMTVNVKSHKSEQVKIKLEDAEIFTKDNVKIPSYSPKFSDMAILKASN
jgi:hypothetical protein